MLQESEIQAKALDEERHIADKENLKNDAARETDVMKEDHKRKLKHAIEDNKRELKQKYSSC